MISKFLRGREFNLPLGGEIGLVAHEQPIHTLARVPVNLVQPLLDIVVGLDLRHIVHNDDAVSAAVIAAGDGTEAFLPRRVPDLKLDGLAIELDGPDFEVDTNRADVALRVAVVGKTQKQAGLANAGVACVSAIALNRQGGYGCRLRWATTYEQELEKIVILWIHAGPLYL